MPKEHIPPIANRFLLALIPPFAEMSRHVCVYHVQGALSLVSSDDEVMGGGGCQVKAKEIIFRWQILVELTLLKFLAVVLEGGRHAMETPTIVSKVLEYIMRGEHET